jgi:hypothetical protein
MRFRTSPATAVLMCWPVHSFMASLIGSSVSGTLCAEAVPESAMPTAKAAPATAAVKELRKVMRDTPSRLFSPPCVADSVTAGGFNPILCDNHI